MLSVAGTTRVLVATSPVDLRGSFNRLYGLVVEQLKADPLSGNLFLFINRRRNRIKILVWDGSGLWICANRLVSHCPLEAQSETLLPISPAV
jgi:transposase